MSQYVPKCAARSPGGGRCSHKRDAQGRFGPYCYWHRNYDPGYLNSGGDARRLRAYRRRFGGTAQWRRYVGGRRFSGGQTPAHVASGEILAEGLEVGREMGRNLGIVLRSMEDPEVDVVPSAVRERAQQRFDRVGQILVSRGVPYQDLGVMHVKGLRVRPFSSTMGIKGRERSLPDVEHDVVIVRQRSGAGQSRDVIVGIDPAVAMFAPVRSGEEDRPLDPEEFPPGKTPFDEGVFIARADTMLNNPSMKWEFFKQEWLG